jgi:hypothetical protein
MLRGRQLSGIHHRALPAERSAKADILSVDNILSDILCDQHFFSWTLTGPRFSIQGDLFPLCRDRSDSLFLSGHS